MTVVDLRSDTVTLPSPQMRRAMYRAELGDDVFGEDPTANRLEALAAERMGKEAALLVPSGTMGNLASLLVHCRRGDEVIAGHLSHSFNLEVGGAAALAGIQFMVLKNDERGMLNPAEVEAAIRSTDDIHYPRTRLICLENTHNYCGGLALSTEDTRSIAQVARRHALALHIDGARIFNAAVALGVEARELIADADSAMFCLSKGLAAPIGSLVVGSRDFIQEARRMRKMLGGGMRQAGVIAAAGIVALESMVERLAEDHANARILAEGIAEMPGLSLDLATVQTNIVIFTLGRRDLTPQELVGRLEGRGVRILAIGGHRLRAVTHYGITAEDIHAAHKAFRAALVD